MSSGSVFLNDYGRPMALFERTVKGAVDIPIGTMYGLATQLISAAQTLVSSFGIAPATDNALDLGTSSFRWRNLFVSGQIVRAPLYGTGTRSATQSVTQNTETPIWMSSASLPSGITHASGVFTNTSSNAMTILWTWTFQMNCAAGENYGWAVVDPSTTRYGCARCASNGASTSIYTGSAVMVVPAGATFRFIAYQNITASTTVHSPGTGTGASSGPFLTLTVL